MSASCDTRVTCASESVSPEAIASQRDVFIPQLSRPAIVIVGPTASGKSDLAQMLSATLGGQVISADSMQVYRGMDIGTGKVPVSERIVPHFGLDLVEPGEPYSVALFQKYARRVMQDIDDAGSRPILCGGTGLYIRGVIDGYEYPEGEQEENPVRAKYEALLQEQGAHALWELLNQRDPESAAVVHENNTRRVVRALELLEQGKSYAVQKENLQTIPQVVPAIQLGLKVDPDVLRERIDRRVDGMVAQGLVEEVQGLLNQGLRDALTAPQAIGYKEIVAYLEGACSLSEAIDQIKTATHRYAKRQRSWFNRDKRIHWVDATIPNLETILKSAFDIISSEETAMKGAQL